MQFKNHGMAMALHALLLGSASLSVQAFAPSFGTRVNKASFTPSSLVDYRTNVVKQYATVVADDTTEEEQCITSPGSQNPWEVHKFGGASLADAGLYRTVGDLLIKESAGRNDCGPIPTMAVVSARGGMTDQLVKVMDSALVDFEEAKSVLSTAVGGVIELLKELAPPEITDPIEERFRQDEKDILSVVQSLRMINTVPAVTMEVVSGYGEIWSAQTLYAYLKTKGVPCDWIDAREILVVKGDSSGLGEKGAASTGCVVPLWAETASRMANWWNTVGKENGFLDLDYTTTSPIVVITGFVATTANGVPTTLKRSGSDYSATVFAKLTGSGRVTMWKNTDGVYTADPRRVPEAFPIASLKYDEAMELAYFGAQVLHPSAMIPCIDDSIPVYVRNIFNPAFEGTVIQGRCQSLKESNTLGRIRNWRSKGGEIPIKGITSVDKIALVTLEGASVIGGASAAERFMGAMADAAINVLIITQASSESSITVAVPENEGEAALAALKNAFELELSRSTINSVSVLPEMSIVAIVGEGMAMKSGVSATFMSSMSRANVNIRLIAQGSSERQVAVVVDAKDTSRALRAAHMAFTLSETTASVAILGSTGYLGSALVRQLDSQKERLAENLGVDMRVNIAGTSKKMLVAENMNGINLSSLSDDIRGDAAKDFDLDAITNEMEADVNPLRVIIDCTNSEDVAGYYEQWLSAGINIISPGRKGASGPLDMYQRCTELQKENSVYWQYESSVGAALPIITTLKDLADTGDNILALRGSVSGALAYVFSEFSEEMPFSEALSRAVEKGYTENDLREDLSGLDTARKVVVLARQIGLDVDVKDVEVESLLPEGLADKVYEGVEGKTALDAALIEDVKAIDEAMLKRYQEAKANDANLRYKFTIDRESGKCSVSLQAVSKKDPLFRLKKNENLVEFVTTRYEESPMIIKGAAAGPELAATGIFADLLRVTRAFSSLQS
mmetsp:Transcript_35122/g.52428  ORF Transcript_35122/g.52428 Transcript_35122/m.52428 type:complete len:963 (-) Transcript_35122:171-3059(-)